MPSYFSNKISTNIGSLGINTSTNTSKDGNARSIQTKSSQTLREVNPIFRSRVMDAEGKEGDIKREDSEATEGEPHDCTGAVGQNKVTAGE